jgi:hypothetical protein
MCFCCVLCSQIEYERQRGIKDITIRLWSRQFNKICRNAKRLGYYTPEYEWCEWNIKDKPIAYSGPFYNQNCSGSVELAKRSLTHS